MNPGSALGVTAKNTQREKRPCFHVPNPRNKSEERSMSSLRVVVFDTVDVVLNVHGERHSVQTFFTHHAAETAGMVGLAERLEDLDAHTNKHTHTHTHTDKITVSLWSEATEFMSYYTSGDVSVRAD